MTLDDATREAGCPTCHAAPGTPCDAPETHEARWSLLRTCERIRAKLRRLSALIPTEEPEEPAWGDPAPVFPYLEVGDGT